MSEENLLEVKKLSITFTQYERGFLQKEKTVVSDLSLSIKPKEMVAVVGASGSGKSLLAHAILGILPYNANKKGKIYYKGEELTQKKIEKLRGNKIVLIPQSVDYLDPLMKIGKQIQKGKKRKKEEIFALLERYGLEREVENKYPFELSGGMIRRVLIAMAVIENPEIVIADEPTPGIPIKMADDIIKHLREIAKTGAGILLITHDLELAVQNADRIFVFYSGTAVEEALAEDFTEEEKLRHPYTKALYRAMPKHGFQRIEGKQPYEKKEKGCPYLESCERKQDRCKEEIPYQMVRGGRVKCIYG